jgi:hypothetical protein
MAGQPHSDEHGSVEAELIARASHNNALYRDDNASVYYLLEEATRTTPYAASIKPFQRAKDGRAAWFALRSQYAGQDKWEQELKKQDDLLHTRVWRGQSNFTLERFVQQHRNAYVSMQSCSQHVEYQLPTEHTRVGYLLEAIQCNDAGLQAAMASIKIDTAPGGKRSDFEAASTHLLPYDPVAKKRSAAGNKRGAGEISDTVAADVSSFGAKEGIGKSGVHLRYHKPEEYETLNADQKDELREWRKSSKDKSKGRGKDKDKKKKVVFTKAMTAAVEKQMEKKLKAAMKAVDEPTDDPTDEQARAYIMSLLKEDKPIPATAATVTAQLQKVTLKSILHKAKNKT